MRGERKKEREEWKREGERESENVKERKRNNEIRVVECCRNEMKGQNEENLPRKNEKSRSHCV